MRQKPPNPTEKTPKEIEGKQTKNKKKIAKVDRQEKDVEFKSLGN